MLAGLVKLIRYMDSLTGPADLESVELLLQNAEVRPDDMIEACQFHNTRYARNLLAKSEWYQLLVICWRTGQSSPIHDHIGSACGVRVVQGVATETTYRETMSGRVTPVQQREFGQDAVLMSNDTDIHLITNQHPEQDLITLHLYTPPLNMRYYQQEGDWSDS